MTHVARRPPFGEDGAHNELVEAVRRVFLHLLGLEGATPGSVVVDEIALRRFVAEVLGRPSVTERPPLLISASGIAVRPSDSEDLVHAYMMCGRLVVERAALEGVAEPANTHVELTCSSWAADHLQSARDVIATRPADQVAICPRCVAVYAHHGVPAFCPSCESRLIVKPLREAADRVSADLAG